ncbi:hypothetical protein [Candidatus Nitrosotenuis sp. DW1]|uniref:hypothetical protein n=1 Tax=Candidatus Nitrosotenuis sp. DW1 TaxID=2259672 RepID=UPI0015CD5DDF|nr:hypothetical protein [Candidatus Nitrosotenuis sp. DW1]QLH08812.1 hypothetical protein DSQ19_04330 [Candidatus Nitrosotenuis sp. DW1]
MQKKQICPACGPEICWWMSIPELVDRLDVDNQQILPDDDGVACPMGWIKDDFGDGRYHPADWIKDDFGDGRHYPSDWIRGINGIYRPSDYR